MNPNLLKAREAAAAKRAAGEKIVRLNPIEKSQRNPKSKSLAVRAYYWEWVGCAHNAVTPEMREEYAALCKKAKGDNAATIKHTCMICVGNGADPNPWALINECRISDCLLHQVRPYQKREPRKLKNHQKSER